MKCGDFGHLSKAGAPCGYRIHGEQTCCPHHDPDQSKARAFQRKGAMALQQTKMPEGITVRSLDTLEGIAEVYTQVARTAVEQKTADKKRLDVILRACNGATQLLGVKETRDLTRALLQLEGRGNALVLKERLKDEKVRVLPGMGLAS